MLKYVTTTTTLIAACAMCAQANAADLGGKAYVPPANEEETYIPPSPIWQGMYWGASLGYGWGQSEHNYDRNDNHGLAEQDLEGGLGALSLGYNFVPAPGFLIGAEADIGIMDLAADDREIFDGHVWKSQFGPLWGTVRGRAGVYFDRTLIYGTGGWAFMDVDEVGYGDAAGQTAENRDLRSGWVVGGGIEHAFLPGVTGKIEYLHMDFGRYDGLSENRETFYFDNTVDVVRTGLNFKF